MGHVQDRRKRGGQGAGTETRDQGEEEEGRQKREERGAREEGGGRGTPGACEAPQASGDGEALGGPWPSPGVSQRSLNVIRHPAAITHPNPQQRTLRWLPLRLQETGGASVSVRLPTLQGGFCGWQPICFVLFCFSIFETDLAEGKEY